MAVEMGTTQVWAMGVAVALLLAAFARFCPKEKLVKMVTPLAKLVGSTIDMLLLKWLPRRAAEKIEEGLFSTIFEVLSQFLSIANSKMLENNKKRIKKEKSQ